MPKAKTSVSQAVCPECESEVDLGSNPVPHEIVQCDECGTELEIINVNPVKLKIAPEVEEDWGE